MILFDESDRQKFFEKVAIVAPPPLDPVFLEAFMELPFELVPTYSLKDLLVWLSSHRPRLIILDSQILKDLNWKNKEVKDFKEVICNQNYQTLLLTKNVNDYPFWEHQKKLPLSIYHGPIQAHSLRKKVMDLLEDHLLLQAPFVMILGEKQTFLNLLAHELKNWGIRCSLTYGSHLKGLKLEIPLTKPHLILYDKTIQGHDSELFQQIETQAEELEIPLLPFQEEASIFQIKDLVIKLVGKGPPLKNPSNGLYTYSTFNTFLTHEIERATAYKEVFTILKFSFKPGDLASLQSKEVMDHLGFFLKNRLRLTDTVAEGYSEGSYLVLFPRVERLAALTAAERLKKQFQELRTPLEDFNPAEKLSYEIFSFPQDFESSTRLGELISKGMENNLAPGRKPNS